MNPNTITLPGVPQPPQTVQIDGFSLAIASIEEVIFSPARGDYVDGLTIYTVSNRRIWLTDKEYPSIRAFYEWWTSNTISFATDDTEADNES